MTSNLLSCASNNTLPSLDPETDYLTFVSDIDNDNFPENTATAFTNTLLHQFEAQESCEVNVKSFWTNWRPEPFVLSTDSYIDVKIVVGPCPLLGKTVLNPYVVVGTDSNLCYSVLTGVINLPVGSVLADQVKIYSVISQGLRSLWLNNGYDMVNNIITSLNYANLGGTVYPQADINNVPFGEIIGLTGGEFGVNTFCLFNLGMYFDNQAPGCAGFFGPAGYPSFIVMAFIDLIGKEPFSLGLVNNTNNFYLETDRNKVKIARLMGLPHDFLMPFSYVDIIKNGHLFTVEMLTMQNVAQLGASGVNTTPFDQSSQNVYYANYNGTNGIFCYNDSVLTVPVMLHETWPSLMVVIDSSLLPNVNNQSVVSVVPSLKMIQLASALSNVEDNPGINSIPLNNPPCNGKLLPNHLFYYGLTAGTVYDTSAVFIGGCLFYNNISTFNVISNNLILRSNSPDFFLDNERLILKMLGPSQMGLVNYGGHELNACAIILTLLQNVFGVIQQFPTVAGQVQWQLNEPSEVYSGQPFPQNWGYATYPQQNILDTAVSNFMPMTWQPYTLQQTLFGVFHPQTLNSRTQISFAVTNDIGEDCEPRSYNGKHPFTCLTLEFKRYSDRNNQSSASYFGCQVPFKRQKGAYAASARFL